MMIGSVPMTLTGLKCLRVFKLNQFNNGGDAHAAANT